MNRMPDSVKNVALLLLLAALAYLLGRASGESAAGGALEAEPYGASGAVSPSPLPTAQGRRTGGKPKGTETEALVFESSGDSSGAANGFIAVTGSYGVGTSVLYVLDTRSKQLAVYEARGGSTNSRRLYLVGARRIDYDLQLVGYNDESEFSHGDLANRFRNREPKTPPASKDAAASRRK